MSKTQVKTVIQTGPNEYDVVYDVTDKKLLKLVTRIVGLVHNDMGILLGLRSEPLNRLILWGNSLQAYHNTQLRHTISNDHVDYIVICDKRIRKEIKRLFSKLK